MNLTVACRNLVHIPGHLGYTIKIVSISRGFFIIPFQFMLYSYQPTMIF